MRAIGIDGGGSYTRFVLFDEQKGLVKSHLVEKPSNYQLVGIEKVKEVFKEGIEKVSDGKFDVVGAGLSGVDRKKDMNVISQVFKEIKVEKFFISNDALSALWGALNGVGILMIAGTGSIVLGRNENGKTARAGGWGYMFEEYCGGFWFSNKAAVAALEFKDGMAPFTTLKDRLVEFYDLAKIEDLIYIYYSDFKKSKVAAAAQVVFEEAEKGDQVANEIVKSGVENALRMISAVKNRCEFPDDFDFSYTGGVFKSKLFLEKMKEAFYLNFPKANFLSPKFDAAVGAAIMALKNLSGENDEKRR
jgi:N-acetylglucosamine kinase-like BadF-type ATPase